MRADKNDFDKAMTECCDGAHSHLNNPDDIRELMPSEEVLYDLADFFKVFSDSTRIKILYNLMYSELCVCDIATALKMEQSAVSHQLRTLKQMDLVRNRREGKAVYYSLADEHIKLILSQGMEHVLE